MTTLVPGMVIKPVADRAVISELCRVLYVSEPMDRVVLIPVEPRRKAKRIYFRGYMRKSFEQVRNQLDPENPLLAVTTVKSRSDAQATDKELNDKYRRRGQDTSDALACRNERWNLIKPLVEGPDGVLLFDCQVLQEKLAAYAAKLANKQSEIKPIKLRLKRLLNQYWAGGSMPGALATFRGACGGRGKEREQKRKLGRHNAPTRAKQEGLEGFVLGREDKEIIRFAWRNYYVRNSTIGKAYRKMCREFYATEVTDAHGKTHTELLPQHQRPTKSQFRTWGGGQSSGEAAWKKQYLQTALNRIDRALLGSADDDIISVGQRAAVDSTPPDIQLVSVLHRLDRIGPAYRILVVDAMYRYIPGFYLGLDAPSSKTVKLAFLHALTDKTEWLKFLGLDDVPPEDWIPIRFSSALADNTDLRTAEVHSALATIGTGLLHVPVARSDMNSPAEVSHHQMHRMVDHNMLGTTYGRRTERGEESADDRARHTVIEAIRETARTIHTHNTMPLDIEPTLEMRKLIEDGIPLTRLNLTRWRISQGKVALNLLDEDECRIKLLPRTRGVFTGRGVKLLRPDKGNKREFIEPHRYISTHSLMLNKFRQAKNERGKHSIDFFDDDFLHDPFKTTEIFYRNPVDGELIPLYLKIKDRELPYETAYDDVIEIMQDDAVNRYFVLEAQDQAMSKMEAGQEATKREAEAEYQAALAAEEKQPSKAKLRANKSSNRDREAELYQYGMPVSTPPDADASDDDLDWGEPGEPAVIQADIEMPKPSGGKPGHDAPLSPSESAPTSLLAQSLAKRRNREAACGSN